MVGATVYFGGDILTMAGENPEYVEALAVKDGKITFAGDRSGALAAAGGEARQIDLHGTTLMPGFVDAHSHFVQVGKNLMDADLFGSKDVADVVARMKAHASKVPPPAWIVGFGYQAKSLTEGRPPTAAELDAISKDRPVLIVDSSGHLGSMNAALMAQLKLDASTKDPFGGTFARKPGSQDLLGPLDETALNAVRVQRPPFTGELADQVMIGATKVYAAAGQTTAMECGAGLGNDDVSLIRNAIDKQLLPLDLIVFAKDSATDTVLTASYSVADAYVDKPPAVTGPLLAARPDLDKRYVNRVRLGGVKFWLDGSVDTAWMRQPYAAVPPGYSAPYYSKEQIPAAELDAFLAKYWKTPFQINMHMNGDAAAEQALTAIEKAIKEQGMRDHRPVFVHATYMTPGQIDRMVAAGGIPSYLFASLYPAGDAIEKFWGPERAAVSAKAKAMVEKKKPYTLSHDAPISPSPVVLPLVWAAVTRVAKSGNVIGPDQRITAYQALRGVTAYAAYQVKEESTKGTLEAGKLADLVILDQNPLKVDPMLIKDIRVLETIKEGKTLYKRDPVVAEESRHPHRHIRPCSHPHEFDHVAGAAHPEDRALVAQLAKAAQGA